MIEIIVMIITQMINASKVYSGLTPGSSALNQINFAANRGELVLLLGPSGSGKTTMLTLLAGMQRPTSGDVHIFERNVKNYSNRELQYLRASRIGFIFQNFNLLESLSVIENVMLVLKFAGISRKKIYNIAISYLQRFEIGHIKNALPKEISHGEKQRVAVARALVNRADFILGDEPTASLDTKMGVIIIELLKESSKLENRCVIIASHDERISKYADRVINLRDGSLM